MAMAVAAAAEPLDGALSFSGGRLASTRLILDLAMGPQGACGGAGQFYRSEKKEMFFMVQLYTLPLWMCKRVFIGQGTAARASCQVNMGLSRETTFQGCDSSSFSSFFFSGGPLALWLETRLDYGNACLQSYVT